MKKPLLLCTIFLCFFLLKTKAQTDTTKYDLGRVQIKKNLSQAITIKGADLEKMPFASLADAINVWLYGAYGSAVSYVPVIDGIVMTDVNALSIYDIDEITLVQNATTVLNGASPQQFLLLIKTRRNRPGKSGIEAAGQTNLVKLHTDKANSGTEKSNTQYYNQYYLSGYVNTANISAGLSADYQRDATPSTSTTASGSKYDVGYAEAVGRYKLNGFLDAKLGNSSTLSLSTGYVPQNGNGSDLIITSSTPLSMIARLKENLYYNNLSLKSSFAGFKNTLTGGYQHLKSSNSTASTQIVILGGNPYSELQNIAADYSANNVLVKDNLSYAFKSGNWEIEPNLNFMYRHYKETNDQTLGYIYYDGNTQVYDTTATASDNYVSKQSLLTPSVNINYRGVLMLQGGFQAVLSNPANNTQGFKPKRIYPFALVMLNVINKANSATGLSIFGSFANANSYMGDIHNSIAYTSTAFNQYIASTYYSPAVTGVANPYNNFNQWQAGANFSLLHNKLSFSYNFSNQQFDGVQTSLNYYTGKLYLHRLGLAVNWAKSTSFSWETNLNTSFIKGTLNNSSSIATHHLTTGGIINRLNYKKAFMGADVLYVLHETTSYSFNSNVIKYQAISLQNLYAGLRLNVNGTKNVEIYANARNLVESKGNIPLLDSRKYYGLGFKLGL